MINSAKIMNIKLIDVPVECYYPDFKRDKTLSYEYYRTFLMNDNLYTVEDYAVVSGDDDVEVAKIICIFTNHERKVRIVVRKYILARNLRDGLIQDGCTEFDDNEVVEDFTRHYIISADRIIRKCCLVFAERDENCIITRSNLNTLAYFSCRYMLKSDGFFPILSVPQIVLDECNFKSSNRKPNSATKQKRKIGSENIPLTSLYDSSDKMKSPKNLKNIKISLVESKINAPIQRNSVKRNLNKSFGDSPVPAESILNYSIVTDEESDDSLVLKLKVSKKNKLPLVVLKKCNDDDDDDKYSVLRTKQKEIRQSPGRRSSRVKVRKSYADYISPVKSAPRKRGVSRRGSESEENSSPIKNSARNNRSTKTEENLETPVKNLLKDEVKQDVILEKRSVRTPKRYHNGDIESPYFKELDFQSSAQGSLRLTSTEAKDVITPRKAMRTSKRRKSPSSDKEGDRTAISSISEKKVNLDESIRRSILKVRLRKAEIEERPKPLIVLNGAHKSKSKSFFFETSSESEGSSDEKKCKNKVRDGDRSEETIRKTPKARRHANNTNSYFSRTEDSIPNTPKSRRRQGSAETKEPLLKTPRSRNIIETPNSSIKQTPKAPKNRAKLIRDGVITPTMHSRSKTIVGDSTPLVKAMSQLHVSYVPTTLPCREKEYCDVYNFLGGKLSDGCGGCMYISGVPGTGKTATVTSVINNLMRNGEVPKFSYVCVNGMKITEPRQSYVEILKQLTGKAVPWEQAQSMLEERFTKLKKCSPVVMLIDELDILCTKKQDVIYNLLDWPTKAKSQLIIITIANTMDLPERLLMSRVTSRLGLTRLTFQAYTHKQLQEIVTKRLFGTDSFNPDAIQLVARKVASVSGDARRALDICRRAAEVAESEGKSQLVNMNHVNEALNAMITQPKVRAIRNCSRLEQIILQSVVAEVERTGVEETSFIDVFKMLISCMAIDGFQMVSSTVAFSAVARLSACRLLLTDQKCNDINQRIILNVSIDDVYYALKKD